MDWIPGELPASSFWVTDALIYSCFPICKFFDFFKKNIDNTIFKNLNSVSLMWFALIHLQKLQTIIEILF